MLDSCLAGATVTLATHTSDGCCLTKWDSDNGNGSFCCCYPALWVFTRYARYIVVSAMPSGGRTRRSKSKFSARTARIASVVSLSNKFVVWLAYVAGKLRLFIVLLPIIALTVIITGCLIRPFRGTPAPQITLFFV